MVKLFMDMDERHGGQHRRAAFVQYLITDVAQLCRGRFASDDVRAEALSVAAAASHLCGWKAYDSGEQGLAQWHYLQSLALARSSGVPGQDGFVMRTMSQQGMKLHRPEYCLALASTGRDRARGRVDHQVEALFAVTHAHALAKTGQTRHALADVQLAESALAAGAGDEVPFWAMVWGPPAATVHSRTAKVFETLGDRPNAAHQYATAAASRPGATYARIIALDLVARAEQAKQGSIEQACTTWGRAIDTMAGVKSTRTLKAVRSLRSDLRPPRGTGTSPAAPGAGIAAGRTVKPWPPSGYADARPVREAAPGKLPQRQAVLRSGVPRGASPVAAPPAGSLRDRAGVPWGSAPDRLPHAPLYTRLGGDGLSQLGRHVRVGGRARRERGTTCNDRPLPVRVGLPQRAVATPGLPAHLLGSGSIRPEGATVVRVSPEAPLFAGPPLPTECWAGSAEAASQAWGGNSSIRRARCRSPRPWILRVSEMPTSTR